MSIRSLFIFCLFPVFLMAHPTEPEVSQGKALFAHPSNHRMEIVTGNKTIINWKTFSIDTSEITEFIQPNENSAVLNRVSSSDVSKIFGSLKSNGTVLLVNPNGIIFGENAIIDTQTFIGSTLDVLDSEFMKGDSLRFRGNSNESIVNLGTIKARGGDVTLIGRYITNEGEISAPKGFASIAVGKEVLIKPSGNDRVFICAQSGHQSQSGTGIHNTSTGTIEALKVRLMADGNPYKFAIKHEGRIDALNTQKQNGDVYLVAEGGSVEIQGEIYASGSEVRILGNKVDLLEQGLIDVSSDHKGGNVYFGGSFHGKDPNILNSISTHIGPKARIDVSAKLNGNGGNAIVWSDGKTEFFGTIDAKGGSRSGNGGLVEVSAKIELHYKEGVIDRSAPYGVAGKLLLDPSNIIISSAPTQNMSSISTPTFGETIFHASGTSPNQIYVNDLMAALSMGPVEISTSSTASDDGDITIVSPLISSTGYTTPYTLTLSSDRDLVIQSQVQNGGTGDIICNVGRDLHVDGTSNASILGSKDGDVTITTQRNICLLGGVGPAQIGFDNPITTGNINLKIGKDLILEAGKSFAQIGHTNSTTNPEAMHIHGDINILYVDGNILMKGGSSPSQYCQIGHATPNFSPNYSNIFSAKGNILIQNVKGSITLFGGTAKGAYTLIGHGGGESVHNDTLSGNISVSANGPISILSSQKSALGNFCGIGFAQDFSGIATHTFHSDHLSVHSNSNITIHAGDTSNHSFIGAYTGNSTVGATHGYIRTLNVSGKNINIQGKANGLKGSDAAIGIVGMNHTFLSNINVKAKENLSIHGGSVGEGHSSAFIQNGDAGEIHVFLEKGNLDILGGARLGQAYIASGGDLSIDVQKGNLNITSRDEAYITAKGHSHIYSRNDINIVGDPFSPENASITSDKNLTVRSGHNINLVHNALIQNTDGDLLVVSGNDVNMRSGSHIENLSEGVLTLVVDHNFPHPPYHGLGALNMDRRSSIDSHGSIRIFTSQQHLNTMQGTINGSSHIQGLLFADATPEKWLIHFSSSLPFSDQAFTIFYKDGVLSGQNIERSQVLVSEMLTDLHPYDEYLGRFLEYQSVYDMNAYDKIHHKGTSSFQVNPNQLYYIRMKKNFDHNHKINHMILFPQKIETEPKLGLL